MVGSGTERVASPAGAIQSDYDKVRRIPFLYAFNAVNTAALLCTVGTPLALYAAELGIEEGRIGILAGLMPFAQLFCILFLPIVMQFSQRIVTATGYGVRHLFLLSWFVAPWLPTPNHAFWLLFVSMSIFALLRSLAETAIWPWSQEYMPRGIRGRISGMVWIVMLPVAIVGSVLIQLWLDSHSGIERFFPIFAVGIVLGLCSVSLLLGLRGGQPRPDSPRGWNAIRAMRVPMRDGRFWLFLYSSGTQYFAFTAISIFLVLFFRDRLGISPGALVTLAAFGMLGGAVGSLIAGWFVDRYGTRAIRVFLQAMQVLLLLSLLLINQAMPAHEVVAAVVFFLVGLLFQSSIGVGSIYLLNYVPPAQKENYMSLAYASDGLIGGGATFLAGILLQVLASHPIAPFGTPVDSYAVLFIVTAVVVVTSAIAFSLLREEGATTVRAFFSYFGHGSAIRALLAIPRYGALTSEERRQELTYGFGGTRSAFVKEELIAALSDPSFDVRHEAIQSLGRLPPSPAVTRALESMLGEDGLVELQYAALAALGRLRSTESAPRIARFLQSENPLLRARAIRSLGDVRDERHIPAVRAALHNDPELDCRLAAVSALGKFRDRESIAALVGLYRALVGDEAPTTGEPRGKVVLLALAKILELEEAFSREWRIEESRPGYRLPGLADRLAATVRRLPGDPAADLAHAVSRSAEGLGVGRSSEAFAALQSLRPMVQASAHRDAAAVLLLLDGTREIATPHRTLLILLALSLRRILSPEG